MTATTSRKLMLDDPGGAAPEEEEEEEEETRFIIISDWNPEWDDLGPSDTEQEKIQIPTRSWRVQKTLLKEPEGAAGPSSSNPTEQTDDETYLRRHKKFELVERRLVRWEMSRRRYEQQREKYFQKEEESLMRKRKYRKKTKSKKRC